MAGIGLSSLYTPQARTMRGKLGSPASMSLASTIHEELPSKLEAGRRMADVAFKERELAQSGKEAEATLAESQREFSVTSEMARETIELNREKMEAEQEAAKTSEAIQMAGLGVQAGQLLGKTEVLGDWSSAGVGGSMGFGLGAAATSYTGNVAIGAGVGAAAGTIISGISSSWDPVQTIIGGVGGAIGSFFGKLFSDLRLKENVRVVGSFKGMDVIEFNYIWSKTKRRGLIAQQVAKIIPEAVSEVNGYLLINYNLV